jgi:hypothetical protein
MGSAKGPAAKTHIEEAVARPVVPHVTQRAPRGGATASGDVHGSVIVLVAPTTTVASVLAKCFKGASDIRVIQDRRRPWPHSERRQIVETPDVERRRGERRRLSRFKFLGRREPSEAPVGVTRPTPAHETFTW